MPDLTPPVIYQLKIVLVGISPMIWRRIKVSSDITIADLHYIIQIVMGWKEEHLHKFLIHGVHYGISYPGTGGLMGNAHEIKLSKFGFREREKFSYEYNFNCSWRHQHGDTAHSRQRLPKEDWDALHPSSCLAAHSRSPSFGLGKLCFPRSVPRHQIRVEAILPEESDPILPVCTAGKGNCPSSKRAVLQEPEALM